MLTVLKSIGLFVAAGLAEIGGGYLIWLWLREHRSFLLAIVAVPVLFSYGLLPTFQPANFGRVFAAYGGVFVALSVAWGWAVDRRQPDVPDVMGAAVALVGMGIIMWWPRE
jgi:small multidrug resistance family-3 protein